MNSRVGIAFDLDTVAAEAAGIKVATIYNTEVKNAMNATGLTEHAQGSFYHSSGPMNPFTTVLTLQQNLRQYAPEFCKYVRQIQIFEMSDTSDITSYIKN